MTNKYESKKQNVPRRRPKATTERVDTSAPVTPRHGDAGERSEVAATSGRESAGPPQRDRSTHLGFVITEELNDRMIGAIQHIGPDIGMTTKTNLIREAIRFYLKQLEAEYNEGERFVRIIPKKKPLG